MINSVLDNVRRLVSDSKRLEAVNCKNIDKLGKNEIKELTQRKFTKELSVCTGDRGATENLTKIKHRLEDAVLALAHCQFSGCEKTIVKEILDDLSVAFGVSDDSQKH